LQLKNKSLNHHKIQFKKSHWTLHLDHHWASDMFYTCKKITELLYSAFVLLNCVLCMLVASLGHQLMEVVALTTGATRAHIHVPIRDHHVCLHSTVNQDFCYILVCV